MKKLLLAIALLLAGCTKDNSAADGYSFGKREYTKTNITVKLVEYKNEHEFYKSLKLYKLPNTVAAFSILNKDTCTIHMIIPETQYEPEYYGHELAHCFYGRWHTDE